MDPIIKKHVLRLFTYGLYVVTCIDGQEVNAFTINWLTQVSFEPPLVAVSVEKSAKSLPMILHSGKFTINVLRAGEEHRKLAGQLGKSAWQAPDKLHGIRYDLPEEDTLVLHDALGWTACTVQQSVEAGDSTLIIGEIVNAGMLEEGIPLTMREAGFRHAG